MPQTLGTDPGSGINGTGTTLQGASTGALGMITRIGISGMESQSVDITTMNCPNKWKKFIAGLKDARTLDIDLIYEKTGTAQMMAALGHANEDWTVTFPDTSTFVANGFIQRLGGESPHDNKVTQRLTIQLSGSPRWYNASSSGS